ncbi:MAG: hypothetical protein V1913_17230, partial [Fibrobacterota bacterium]
PMPAAMTTRVGFTILFLRKQRRDYINYNYQTKGNSIIMVSQKTLFFVIFDWVLTDPTLEIVFHIFPGCCPITHNI